MHLVEFTTIGHPVDKDRITRVRLLVADHPDPDRRTEWLEAQVSVDEQTVLNGALLRSKVLSQARDTLDLLARDYERLGRSILK